MAIARNNQINYPTVQEYVYHKTGKRLRSWKKDISSLRTFFLFEDGSMGVTYDGSFLESMEDIQPYDIPKSFCTSCGEEWHGATSFDWQGRCHVSLKNFWNKVRKVYWHRYIVNKNSTKTN